MKMRNKRKVILLLVVFDVAGMILLCVTTANETTDITPGKDLKTPDVNVTRVISSHNRLQARDFPAASRNGDTFVYSAYAEEIKKGQHRLRLIGVTLNKNRSSVSEAIRCRLRYSKSHTTEDSSGFVENIPEDHDLNYTAAYFLCPIHNLPVPDTVSITYNDDTTQHQYIPVSRISDLKRKHLFTVCLSPLHSGYNDSSQLLEWIELNKILGVQKFNIYVNNVTDEIMAILRYFEAEGIVEILPWSLPSHLCTFDENVPLLHSCGQLAALNDCLYRTKGQSQYITSLDIDEFIIPQHTDDITWSDMLRRLPVASGYLFLNSFISANTTAEYQNYLKTKLKTTSYLTRDNVIFIGRVRSKVIAWADRAVNLGVHHVWSFTSGRERGVPPEVGLLHHYRDRLVQYPADVPVRRFKTTVTQKYHKHLQERVILMRNKLTDVHFR